MEKELLQALRYFHFFKYAPLKDEIYTFLKKNCPPDQFHRSLERLLKKKKVKQLLNNPSRYTVGGYSKQRYNLLRKLILSREKIAKTQLYIRILAFFPQVKLVGLSGSVAMLNADQHADIDLFIISAVKRLWTARFIAIVLAKSLRLHRSYDEKHVGDKVCLNLFFDEKNLAVPGYKKNEYVAHEVLQMRPQAVKGDVYLRYLDSNRWVFDIFPNAKNRLSRITKKKRTESRHLKFAGDILEKIVKKWQLQSINKRRTSEIITDTQLWFFPDDFEKQFLSRHKIALNKKDK